MIGKAFADPDALETGGADGVPVGSGLDAANAGDLPDP